ncbi:MAG: ABC transporter ATP-binding protein [Pseudomonadota bacterium]
MSSSAEAAPVETAPAVTIRGTLDFGAAGALGPFDLTLAPGAWTALLGPSGVGKSTLLRLIAGLPTAGRLEGDGITRGGAAGRIAYMGQTDLLAPWLDVIGNVTLGARLRGERADRDRAAALIERVGLAGREGARPSQLSGGQRQRVALARTLMEDRPLVLLDEPFSALDARTRAEMQELAFDLLAGRTVLIVTHDPAEAARLGSAIWLMAGDGITAVPPPTAAPIRDPGAAETLAMQADLLARLRAAPLSAPLAAGIPA